MLALERNIFRHAQRHWESLGCAEHGISNAGIAAGGVEQNSPGTHLPAAPRLGHNMPGRTIFDRATGVTPFGLTQKCNTGQVAGERVEAYQRGISDALDQTLTQRLA